MTDFDKLVLRAQQGSKTAMNTVINYMYRRLLSRTAKSWHEAPGGHSVEDIVQYAMIEVYDAIKTYNGKGSAINWMWMHAKGEIYLQARYLNYNKRKANISSTSLDKPISTGNDADEVTTLASVLPCRANTENEAIGNICSSGLIQYLKSESTELELIIMEHMIQEYKTIDMVAKMGYPTKTVTNAKERIKAKARRYLAAVG